VVNAFFSYFPVEISSLGRVFLQIFLPSSPNLLHYNQLPALRESDRAWLPTVITPHAWSIFGLTDRFFGPLIDSPPSEKVESDRETVFPWPTG
jgi:hypothetical protein